MAEVLDEDLQGYGQSAPVQAPTTDPSLGNQDISKGPVMSMLPTPYQPPAQTGPWDSSQYASEAFKRLPPDVALKAMEAAVQLEGNLGYAADIKAGVPEMQALSKWAPKMYHRNPAVAARLIQQQSIANKPAFQPEELTLPSGQKVTRMSPQRVAFSPKGPRAELTPSENIHSITAQMKGLQDQIKNETDPNKEAALWQKHNALVDQLGGLRTKTATTAQGGDVPQAPKNAKDRGSGIVYMTPKGPHKWTGEHWTLP